MAGVFPCMAIFQFTDLVMITSPTGVQDYWVLERIVSTPIQRSRIWTFGDRLMFAKAGGFIPRQQANRNNEPTQLPLSSLPSYYVMISRVIAEFCSQIRSKCAVLHPTAYFSGS
jgi:hypothetical protein